jgi:hypothetical protein
MGELLLDLLAVGHVLAGHDERVDGRQELVRVWGDGSFKAHRRVSILTEFDNRI